MTIPPTSNALLFPATVRCSLTTTTKTTTTSRTAYTRVQVHLPIVLTVWCTPMSSWVARVYLHSPLAEYGLMDPPSEEVAMLPSPYECVCVCECGWALWCVLNSWRVQMITVQSQKEHSKWNKANESNEKRSCHLTMIWVQLEKSGNCLLNCLMLSARRGLRPVVLLPCRREGNECLFAHDSGSQVLHLSLPLLLPAARPKS